MPELHRPLGPSDASGPAAPVTPALVLRDPDASFAVRDGRRPAESRSESLLEWERRIPLSRQL